MALELPAKPALAGVAGVAAAGQLLGRRKKLRGCIYARFSTKFQHSIDDQLRACREWADKHNVTVLDRHVFSDAGETGKKNRRPGHQAMLAALAAGEVDVVITFATNRLHRKMHRALRFVEETIVEQQRRCVFVAQNIDTADEKMWKALVYVFAMLDEVGVQMSTAHIRQAHIGLALKRFVTGTLAFGYIGVEVAGTLTRLNRARRTVEVDPSTAPFVPQIFRWFVNERLRYKQIARRLKDQNVLPPPKVKRWTSKAVKYLLMNRRYIGDWSYGWRETLWQSQADYARQFQRDTPTHEHHDESLRLIDDSLFLRAEERIAEKRGFGGRPSHQHKDQHPDILTEVLWCPTHRRYVSIRGGGSKHVACPTCKSTAEGQQPLYSLINRQRARAQLCQELARRVIADPELVESIIQSCRQQIEVMQRPDEGQLDKLRADRAKLATRAQFILENPGSSESDYKENAEALAKIRSERSTIERQLAEAEAVRKAPAVVPERDEVVQLLNNWAEILTSAADSSDAADWGDAMAIVRMLTGGKVVLSQQGDARAKRGWLRGTFRLQLVGAIQGQSSMSGDNVQGEEITIDFREPTEAEAIADAVKALFDQGLLVKQIATTLTANLGYKVGRNLVKFALNHWYESRGLGPAPDGRKRRATLEKQHLVAPKYQQLAPEVGRLEAEGMLLQDIAKRLGCDRNTVTQSLAYWRKTQQIPEVDDRARRKALVSPTGTGERQTTRKEVPPTLKPSAA